MKEVVSLSLIILMISCKTYADGEFILNTAKCQIPNLNPFTDELKDIIKSLKYTSCDTSEIGTYVTKTKNAAVLNLRTRFRSNFSSKKVNCFYCNVSRNGSLEDPDVGIKLSKCQNFFKQTVLKYDSVKVTCQEYDYTNSEYKIAYENVHNPVLINKWIKEKLVRSNATNAFSVLLVVLDSTSRLNFIRAMPQSYSFLRDNNFLEMKGYTKIGRNTFPNAMALLAGFNLTQSHLECNPEELNGLDQCPLLWYDYRKLGYVTAYAEDATPISTFNFNKKGFTAPPTDYYFKPHLEAAEKLNGETVENLPFCAGPETSGERILNLAKDFALTFRNKPTFGVFWMNTFTHNDVNAPSAMDEKFKQFFVDIKDAGVLDESIVFLLSDHGVRYGDIRKTRSGWLEERMPVNMISLPDKFQNKFQQEYDNLKGNADKLTSTYDMFMTLQHILTLSGVSYTSRRSSACPKCLSLFDKVPKDRSCKDAGIPDEWCTCIGYFSPIDPDHEYVKSATAIALDKIKLSIRSEQPLDDCEEYTFRKIISSSISDTILEGNATKYLFVVFEAEEDTTFLLTVKFQQFVDHSSTFFVNRIDNEELCVSRNNESKTKCRLA
ncbi:unnamed protein product [Tenebrio molitor]|nr:unnamed protein product [Tenebrio molitor]